MADNSVTVERLEAFYHNTQQALIYAESLVDMNLSHASMGIPYKSGVKRNEMAWDRPLEAVTGESIAASAFMLAEEIGKLDADAGAYTALRAVAFANDGSAHQNAYRFVRDVIQTLHVVCGYDWFGERPSDDPGWEALGASMVPLLPMLVRRLKVIPRPDIARLETIMGDELLKATAVIRCEATDRKASDSPRKAGPKASATDLQRFEFSRQFREKSPPVCWSKIAELHKAETGDPADSGAMKQSWHRVKKQSESM